MLRVLSGCVLALLLVQVTAAQDRVTYIDHSSKTGSILPCSGTISLEDPGKVTITSGDNRRSDIPVSDIVDVVYDGEPTAEMNAARTAERECEVRCGPGWLHRRSQKSGSDKKLLCRHLEYKLAEMRTAQADAGILLLPLMRCVSSPRLIPTADKA